MTTAPSAVAFHGTPYRASGLGCVTGTPVCIPVVLEWGGAGIFRLGMGVLVEPVPPVMWGPTSVVVPLATIQGREQFTNVFFGFAPWCGNSTEFTDYVGYDTPTGGQQFRVTGSQDNCLNDGISRQIQLTGHWTTWQLTVSYGMLPV